MSSRRRVLSSSTREKWCSSGTAVLEKPGAAMDGLVNALSYKVDCSMADSYSFKPALGRFVVART